MIYSCKIKIVIQFLTGLESIKSFRCIISHTVWLNCMPNISFLMRYYANKIYFDETVQVTRTKVFFFVIPLAVTRNGMRGKKYIFMYKYINT